MPSPFLSLDGAVFNFLFTCSPYVLQLLYTAWTFYTAIFYPVAHEKYGIDASKLKKLDVHFVSHVTNLSQAAEKK